MNEDLITNSFIDHVDKTIIQKVVTTIRIGLFLYIVYGFFHLLQWYPFLKSSLPSVNRPIYFYDYRILPVISLLNLILAITTWFLNLRATKMVYVAIEDIIPEKLNQGYKLLYKSALLALLTIVVGTIGLVIKFILHLNL